MCVYIQPYIYIYIYACVLVRVHVHIREREASDTDSDTQRQQQAENCVRGGGYSHAHAWAQDRNDLGYMHAYIGFACSMVHVCSCARMCNDTTGGAVIRSQKSAC